MKIQKLAILPEDFKTVLGEAFFNADTIQHMNMLSSEEHNSVDNVFTPFWATKVQDILEKKTVTYTEREVQEQEFLGLKIIPHPEEIIVSIGKVGDTESVVQVVFSKTTDEVNGGYVVETVKRIEWSHLETAIA